ncbi:MAG: DinB family protein [Caldilineaceae bacterium]
MPATANDDLANSIRTELEETRTTFHALLASLSVDDLQRQSFNVGWTNGEILAHMLFGFIILNALLPLTRFWGRLPPWTSKPFAGLLNLLTVPFNWINALGARGQGKVFTYARLGKLIDWVFDSLLKKVDSIKAEEWQRGMYYPTRWDANFSTFMTLERLFHYPVIHFHFHQAQISR